MNPFKYGQVVSGDDFCVRPKLIREISNHIRSSQNIYVQGERRIGKTSLICETVHRMKKIRLMYVDLMEVKSSDDLTRRLIKAYISTERETGVAEKIFKALAHLKPSLSFDPLTGSPVVSLDASVTLGQDSLEGVLDLILSARKRRGIVVVFDEFQDILKLDDARRVTAALRGKIQFHTSLPYIFAGSIRNRMDTIFSDPDSPFFKSAIPINVGPLNRDAFHRFIVDRFTLGKRSIGPGLVEELISLVDDVAGDVQQLCGAFWETTSFGQEMTREHLPGALELIYARESKGYDSILGQITGLQLKTLVGLATLGGKSPTSSRFLKGAGITQPSSVKRALTRLIDLKIVIRRENEYRFVNPFFGHWLSYKGL